MQHTKTLLWSILLTASCSAPGVAQQAPAATADRPAYCAEYYGCIESRPLSEAEARSSRGYPASTPPEAEIASRGTKGSTDTGAKGRPAPIDLSARQPSPVTAF